MTDMKDVKAKTRKSYAESAKAMLEYVENSKTFLTDKIITLPTSIFTDADRWGKEMSAIFEKLPLCLATTAELRDIGDYKAADMLAEEGIDCEVIDLRTIRPMDYNAILESVKKTNRLVILEESWPFGNIATEITFQVQSQIFDYLDAPIEKINTADTPAPYSPVLLAEWLPNANDVIKSVKKVMYLS